MMIFSPRPEPTFMRAFAARLRDLSKPLELVEDFAELPGTGFIVDPLGGAYGT
jgi:hypothetical protein